MLTELIRQKQKRGHPRPKADDALVSRLSKLSHTDLVRWCDRQWQELPLEEVVVVVERSLGRE